LNYEISDIGSASQKFHISFRIADVEMNHRRSRREIIGKMPPHLAGADCPSQQVQGEFALDLQRSPKKCDLCR